MRHWLTDARYAPYAEQIAEHIADARWGELEEAFWRVIPFGTAGRRGKMYPIGPGAINDRTIGESAQGLADYVRRQDFEEPLRCAIGYDTRHNSRRFAELTAEVLAANGFEIYFLDGQRSTPALAFTVRAKQCQCGVMVSASHNPPSDNAVKVFWADGGQLRPPHDQGVIECVAQVTEIHRRPFAEVLAAGQIHFCQTEIDAAYLQAVLAEGFEGPRALKILYSPLHGVGGGSVYPALLADGFENVELYAPHATPDGDFPNVPNQIANPEEPAVFAALIEHAVAIDAELILASDPDADRLGCAARLTPDGDWQTLSGNQIGVLLGEFLLRRRQHAGRLSPEHFLVKTLVTSEMLRRVAGAYGVRTVGDVLTGFKWIGSRVDELRPENFVLGTEEAHGYLVGTFMRDKDGAAAAMLLAELAAELKVSRLTLHQHLDALYQRFGCHQEKTLALSMPGADGMRQMQQTMERLRQDPPQTLGSLRVRQVRDYLNGQVWSPGQPPQALTGPQGDLLFLDLDPPGNYAAVRPSGTEPKIKFYLFTYLPPKESQDVAAAKALLAARLTALEHDLLPAR